MFSRWHNLAAAAGAIWLPLAFAQAAPRSDDLHCTRPATCARFHERTITDEQIEFDQDNWYRRYYGNTLNETTSNDASAPRSEDPENYGANGTTSNDDEYDSQFAPTFDEFDNTTNNSSDIQTRLQNTKTEVDSEGRCSDPTCPCHTIIDLDSDEEFANDAPPFSSQPAQRPIAILTGTIEPIFDDSEEEAINADIPEAGNSTNESTIPNIDEPTSDDETLGDDSFEAFGDSEVSPSSDPTNYHMFYPGCDWSAYDPSVRDSGASPETAELLAEQTEPASSQSSFVPGADTLLLLWF